MNAYILRGLPGSGKSTLAKALVNNGFICSTDDFFMENGIYKFDIKKIGAYHKLNQETFKHYAFQLANPLICDNTNMAKWEMEPYIEAAKDNKYNVHIITVGNPLDPLYQVECAERNTHGVTLEIIQRMAAKFEL